MGLPSMTDSNHMVNVTESELEQLVGQDAASVGEAKEGMIREHRP